MFVKWVQQAKDSQDS
uniref:MIP37130p1 n=1 Tax=Drosophila melanogaster TaxID=7227 RepID=R9UK28_DROME|nr:MIP37130p1 [Drosophila melanogaster]